MGHDASHTHASHSSIGVNDHHNQAHTASDHTDITRTAWVPVFAMQTDGATNNALGTTPDIIRRYSCANGSTQGAYFDWQMPSDAVAAQAVTMGIYWVGSASETAAVRWQYNCLAVAAATDVTTAVTPTAFTGSGAAKTANALVIEAAQQIVASATAGNVLRVAFSRVGADAADTYTGTAGIIGVSLNYSANQ